MPGLPSLSATGTEYAPSPTRLARNDTPTNNSTDAKIDIIAPSGKLGVVLDSPPEGGMARVSDIKEYCLIKDEIHLGDKVIAIDDEDVSTMKAFDITKLLASRRSQAERKITVLRGSQAERKITDLREGVSQDGKESNMPGLPSLSATGTEYAPSPTRLARNDTPTNNSTDAKIDIIAPSGKLGVVLDSPPEGGMARVSDIKEYCLIKDEIHLGDKVIAIDDEDVSTMKAFDITKLLARRRKQAERKITVIRADGGAEATAVSGSASPPMVPPHSSSSPQSNNDDTANSSAMKINIIAPAGKLGLVLGNSLESGAACVSDIKENSPIKGEIYRGDKVVAVDDQDVSGLTAVDISILFAKKSEQAERKITVLRNGVGHDGKDPITTGSALFSNTSTEDAPLLPLSQNVTSKSSKTSINIIAPSGKLGIVLDSPFVDRGVYVSEIKEDSLVKYSIRLGDKVVGIDEQDVSKWSANDMSRLLASKSGNARRKITVLREKY